MVAAAAPRPLTQRRARYWARLRWEATPSFAVIDGRGLIYGNLEDKSEIVALNARTLSVQARYPLAPLESPSGLALDTKNRRLFAVCDGGKMAVVNADTGKVLATPAIGDGPDAAAYDPGTGLAFSANGEDGTLTVIARSGVPLQAARSAGHH